MPVSELSTSGPVSGNLELYRGKRRATWYARWRDVAGRHRRKLGPAWTAKSAPPPGFLRERDAKAALESILVDARRGAVQQARTGVTFSAVADAWLAQGRLERDWKPSTLVDYRSVLDAHLRPRFADARIEAISASQIEKWRNELVRDRGVSRRTANKILLIFHGVLEHACQHSGLVDNPAARVKQLKAVYDDGRFDFFSPEEVMLLAGAVASPQDAALFVTAAFSGLRRGELLALRWRQVDFDGSSVRVIESYAHGQRTRTKSGHARTVPMVAQVHDALGALKQRAGRVGAGDLVFPGHDGGHLDGSALRRRYAAARERAGLRPLRFHDLRHTFGSLAINYASIVQVQAWMGHADVHTTMRYLHHKSRADDARLLSHAFASHAA